MLNSRIAREREYFPFVTFSSPDAVSSLCSQNRDGNFMSNIPKTVDGVVLESRSPSSSSTLSSSSSSWTPQAAFYSNSNSHSLTLHLESHQEDLVTGTRGTRTAWSASKLPPSSRSSSSSSTGRSPPSSTSSSWCSPGCIWTVTTTSISTMAPTPPETSG